MELECLGSSSAGNCYLLKAKDETLILECGVPFAEVKKALGWTLRAVAGCLVSHEHKDHSRSIADCMRCGIQVLAPEDAFKGIRNRAFARPIEPMRGYKIGGFKAFALPMSHDVPCLGYVIEHEEMGKTLFATDTMMLEHRVAGLSHIMVEANYSDDILQANMDSGAVPHTLRDRLMRTHMELRTAAAFVKSQDLSHANEIVLLHLSSQNSDPERFRAEIARASGKPVHIAAKGLKIDFSKQPY